MYVCLEKRDRPFSGGRGGRYLFGHDMTSTTMKRLAEAEKEKRRRKKNEWGNLNGVLQLLLTKVFFSFSFENSSTYELHLLFDRALNSDLILDFSQSLLGRQYI